MLDDDTKTVVNTIIDGNAIGYSTSGTLIRNISRDSSCMLLSSKGVALYTKAGTIDPQDAMVIGYPSWFVTDALKGSFIECKPINAAGYGHSRRNIDAPILLSPFIPSWWERRPSVVRIDAVFVQSAINYLEPTMNPEMLSDAQTAITLLNGMLDALIKLPPHATLADVRCIDIAYNSTEEALMCFFGIIAPAIRKFVPHLKLTFDNSECDAVNGDTLSSFVVKCIHTLLSGSGKEYGYASLEITNESDDRFQDAAVQIMQQQQLQQQHAQKQPLLDVSVQQKRRRLCSSRIVSIVCSEFARMRNVHTGHLKTSADFSALQSYITCTVLYAYYDQSEPFHNVSSVVALRGKSQRDAVIRSPCGGGGGASRRKVDKYNVNMFLDICNAEARAIAGVIVKAKAAHVESLYFPIPATRSCNVVPVNVTSAHFGQIGVDVRGFDTLDLGFFNVPGFLYEGATASSSLAQLRCGFPDSHEWCKNMRNETAPTALEWNRIVRLSSNSELAENVGMLIDDRIVHIGVASLSELRLALATVDTTRCTTIRIYNVPPSILNVENVEETTTPPQQQGDDGGGDEYIEEAVERRWFDMRLSDFSISITTNDLPLAAFVKKLFSKPEACNILSTCRRISLNAPDDVITAVLDVTSSFRALNRLEVTVHRLNPITVGASLHSVFAKAPELRTLVLSSDGETCADTMKVLLSAGSGSVAKCLNTLQVWCNDGVQDYNYGRLVNLNVQRMRNKERARITFPNIRYCVSSCPAWNFTGDNNINMWFNATGGLVAERVATTRTASSVADRRNEQRIERRNGEQRRQLHTQWNEAAEKYKASPLECNFIDEYASSIHSSEHSAIRSKRRQPTAHCEHQHAMLPSPVLLSSPLAVTQPAQRRRSPPLSPQPPSSTPPPSTQLPLKRHLVEEEEVSSKRWHGGEKEEAVEQPPPTTEEEDEETRLRRERELFASELMHDRDILLGELFDADAPIEEEEPLQVSPQRSPFSHQQPAEQSPSQQQQPVVSPQPMSPSQPKNALESEDDAAKKLDELNELLSQFSKQPASVQPATFEELPNTVVTSSHQQHFVEDFQAQDFQAQDFQSQDFQSQDFHPQTFQQHLQEDRVEDFQAQDFQAQTFHPQTFQQHLQEDRDEAATASLAGDTLGEESAVTEREEEDESVSEYTLHSDSERSTSGSSYYSEEEGEEDDEEQLPPPPMSPPIHEANEGDISEIGTIQGYGSSITKVLEGMDDDGAVADVEGDDNQPGCSYDDVPNSRSVAFNNSYIARATGKLY